MAYATVSTCRKSKLYPLEPFMSIEYPKNRSCKWPSLQRKHSAHSGLRHVDVTRGMSSAAYPHEGAEGLGHEMSEQSYKEWEKYWTTDGTEGIVRMTHGPSMDWQRKDIGDTASSQNKDNPTSTEDGGRRWIFALRHGERVDLTYGLWTEYCFDKNGDYVRRDLNMPLKLGKRAGGADSYARDSSLTRVGRLQAQLVGEGLRLARAPVVHVFASAALRCVETAHHLLEEIGDGLILPSSNLDEVLPLLNTTGLNASSSVKIKVEPGLFEYKMWHMSKRMPPFMTPLELHLAGYNVDLNYKPYVELDTESDETIEECYQRNQKVMHSALRDTEAEGGNVIFVGHAATLDIMVIGLNRLRDGIKDTSYQVSKQLNRVPYCALAAMRDRPLQLVPPPCPPSVNSSSGRFDWKILQDL